MSDRLGMIHAIHEQPADDLPRLAYADWLEERGEVDHAEFVRVEVALSHVRRGDPAWRPLFERELKLIRTHKDTWFGAARGHWDHYEIRRGFIEEVSSRDADAVLPHLDWLYSHHSLIDLYVCGTLDEARSVLQHPVAGILARLDLPGRHSYRQAWPADLPRHQPLSERPLALSLASHRAGSALLDALLGSPHLGRVARLDLRQNVLTAAGLERLLDHAASFPRLTNLRLAGRVTESSPRRRHVQPNIGSEGVILLASHPLVAQLRQLDVESNRIDADAVQALVESPHLAGIEQLVVGEVSGRAEARRLRDRFGDLVLLPHQ